MLLFIATYSEAGTVAVYCYLEQAVKFAISITLVYCAKVCCSSLLSSCHEAAFLLKCN